MANSKDVELRIRARDFSQKPLKAVASAIEAMAKAQDDQRKAAERGEVSTRQLEASYKKLEQAGQQLLKLNALVELYKRQNATMVEAARRAAGARSEGRAMHWVMVVSGRRGRWSGLLFGGGGRAECSLKPRSGHHQARRSISSAVTPQRPSLRGCSLSLSITPQLLSHSGCRHPAAAITPQPASNS